MDPTASKKGDSKSAHIIDYRGIDLQEDVAIQDQPVQILERRERIFRNRAIPLVKVKCSQHGVKKATWECEDLRRSQFQYMLSDLGII